MKNETLILALAGGGLAYFFWKHPQGKTPAVSSSGATTSNGNPAAVAGAPVTPKVAVAGAGSAFSLGGSAASLGVDLKGIFDKIFPKPGKWSATSPGADPTKEQYVSNAALSSAAKELLAPPAPLPTLQYFQPGGAPEPEGPAVDPGSADNTPDFEQGNPTDDFSFNE